MASASKVCSVSSTTYEPRARLRLTAVGPRGGWLLGLLGELGEVDGAGAVEAGRAHGSILSKRQAGSRRQPTSTRIGRMTAMAHPRAGQPALPEDLIDVDAVLGAYYDLVPDPTNPDQQVVFGTSGHRGSSLDTAFNDKHIAATTQAIVEYRAAQGITGPLYIGKDTHALSLPAWKTAIEVLRGQRRRRCAAEADDDYTPTPAVSRAIVVHNADRGRAATPPTASWSPRRTTRRATAASSTTRRTADRPTPTRPPDRGPGQRAAGRHVRGSGASRSTRSGGDLTGSTTSAPTARTWSTRSTCTPSATPACTSAPTRSAAPACSTGPTSPSTSAST